MTTLPDFRWLAGTGIAGDEAIERLAVGEIKPAFSGDEELPPDGRLAIVKRHLQPGGGGHFRRAEASGAAADDGELRMGVHGRQVMRRAAFYQR